MTIAPISRCFSLAMLTVLFHPAAAFAQHGQDAAVIGTVRDTSGAVVKGATVTVASAQFGGAQSVTTDDQGAYHIVFLRAGDYDMRAALSGFSSRIRNGITLRPGLTFTVDFTLQAAGIAETVDVHKPLPHNRRARLLGSRVDRSSAAREPAAYACAGFGSGHGCGCREPPPAS